MAAIRSSLLAAGIFTCFLACCTPAAVQAKESGEYQAAYDAAKALAKQGDYAAAVRKYEEALALAQRLFGPDSEQVAKVTNDESLAYVNLLDYPHAEPLAKRTLEICEARYGPNHPEVSKRLSNLGRVYYKIGDYARAAPLFERAVQIRNDTLGPNHPDLAHSLNFLAIIREELGQFAEAETLFQRALRIREAASPPSPKDLADVVNNVGSLYVRTGRLGEAEPFYLRSLALRQAALGADHIEVAQSFDSLAGLYYSLGQYRKSENHYRQSLQIKIAKLGRDHPEIADGLVGLGQLYADTQQYRDAELALRRAADIYAARLGPDHPKLANALDALAQVYRYAGLYDKAEPLFLRSIKISEARMGPEHLKVISTTSNLGMLYLDMGQYEQSEAVMLRALKAREAVLGPEHPSMAIGLNALAVLHAAMGKIPQAAADFDRQRRGVRQHVATVLPALSERDQLAFLYNIDQRHWHNALSLARAQPHDAQFKAQSAGWLINGKAVAHDVLAKQAQLVGDSRNPVIAAAAQQLRELRAQLASLIHGTPPPGQEQAYRQRLSELTAREQELARQVNLAAGRGAQADSWVETDSVRQAIAPGAVLVDIVCLEPAIFTAKSSQQQYEPPQYLAWVVPPAGQGEVQMVGLGAAEPIDAAVAAARQAISDSARKIQEPDDEGKAEAESLQALGQLAKLVFEPLKPHLAGAKQLIVCPDSELWLVPWAALPVESGKYAAEQYQLRFVNSGRDLVREQSTGGTLRTARPPMLFADPDYDLDRNTSLAAIRAVLRGKEKQLAALREAPRRSRTGLPKVGRLPGTAIEASLIRPSVEALTHQTPTVYSDQYALEGVFKEAHSPQVLVLSTHGYYFPPQHAAGEAGGKRDPSSNSPAPAAGSEPLENPLLRCGLLLAGCNQPPAAGLDDGILTGMEIVGADLRGTELVVLSACETGLGQVHSGEGVAGLRQAFQLAGAKAVVSSLWSIPDQETAALMNTFFGNLAAGQSRPEALRNAQLAQIQARRQLARGAAHPFYWAAFTVTGN